MSPGKNGHVRVALFAGKNPNSPCGSSGAKVTLDWQALSITEVVVAVTKQPCTTALTVLVHGVRVKPPDIGSSVQYLVKSVAVCVLVQLSKIVIVPGVASHSSVTCLVVEVHIVRGADRVEPSLMPINCVMMLQNLVTCVASMVSHARLDSEPDEVNSVVDPNSVDGIDVVEGILVVVFKDSGSSVDGLGVGDPESDEVNSVVDPCSVVGTAVV